MRRRCLRFLMIVLWLGSAGCMDSCDCGAGEGDGEPSGRVTPPVAVPENTAPSQPVAPSASDAGTPQLRGYVPLPEGELRKKVEAMSKGVAWERKLGKPVKSDVLTKVLAERVGPYTASAKPSVDERQAGEISVVIATREYQSSGGTLYVKVSDTASAVPLRTGFRDMLLVEADEGGGFQRAEILGGALGLTAFHPRERVSRAITLVRERFLVELIARDTDDPNAAKDALAALPLATLR